ncbi:MAG: YggT family protein [Anaerolineae bacterium]|nr:YggT family protein [Anaerolineae bacterium]
MIILIVIRLVNIIFGLIGLGLVLRVVLPWLKVSTTHPVMVFLYNVTDPIVQPVRRMMGSGFIGYGAAAVDVAPLAALFLLWLIQAVVIRILNLIAYPPVWILYPGRDLGIWLSGILGYLLQLYYLALLIRILLEWIRVSYAHPVMKFLWNITEPPLSLIRRYVPSFAGMDFSPVILIILLNIIQTLLSSLLQTIF